MRGWKFWERDEKPEPAPPPAPEPPRRFSARPRTDLLDPGNLADPAKAEQFDRLRKRREAVLFDVERAEQATEPDNPWTERIRLLDEALATTQAERGRRAAERLPAGDALPATAIEDIAVAEGPPPRVTFTIGSERFAYAEELDWAERGFQIARGDLLRETGDPAHLVPPAFPAELRDALTEHLDASLFDFASDVRDRALAGQPFPVAPTLADLARPDAEHGGWLTWRGTSPAGVERERALRELDAEIARLSAEREREREELAKWADRLPIARRRLADVDAEIAGLTKGG